ncbi:MAG: hypothetical protein HY801_14035 [Candidatus Lindowbacteria bacterium]|nr:hypothetical protein [Candidatus Lindowbacteria bacterium]
MTTYYLDVVGVTGVALFGAILGFCFSRLRKPYWALGYVVPFAVIAAVAVSRRWPAISFIAPFSYIMAGRTEFVALSLACAAMLTTVLARLLYKRQRITVGVFMVVAVVYLSILPFLLPALFRDKLSKLESNLDSDGVCLQSNHYNCGPASAVTALRRLEVRASEGEIAVHSYSNPISGTEPDSLCHAINELYGRDGIFAEHRVFRSIPELQYNDYAVVLVKHSLLVDHYATVLDVTNDKVVLGDPLVGKRTLSHEEFEKIWRFSGIVMKRDSITDVENEAKSCSRGAVI